MSRTDPLEEPDNLLFAPVQTAWRGASGWSAEAQRAFVGAIARCGAVAAAARSVGRSPSSAYQLRRRAGENSPFARAWDEARGRAGDDRPRAKHRFRVKLVKLAVVGGYARSIRPAPIHFSPPRH